MQMNPDGYETREDAMDYLFDRKQIDAADEKPTSTLLDAFTKPV